MNSIKKKYCVKYGSYTYLIFYNYHYNNTKNIDYIQNLTENKNKRSTLIFLITIAEKRLLNLDSKKIFIIKNLSDCPTHVYMLCQLKF